MYNPTIPNSLILEALQKEGIITSSPITTIKVGYAHASNEFALIGSFKRQTYIHPEDTSKLPSSILITFEETNYRIFIIDDTITCFLCKQIRHLSSSCKKFFEAEYSNLHNINQETPAFTSNLNYETTQINTNNNIANLNKSEALNNTHNSNYAIYDTQD